MNKTITDSNNACVPQHSESRLKDSRRLRTLYGQGAAGDYRDEPISHFAAAAFREPQEALEGRARPAHDPWYMGGAGLGPTAPLAARTRYGEE